MKRFVLFLLLILPTLAHAQEVITSYDPQTLPVINEELRKSSAGISSVRKQIADLLPLDLSLYGSNVTGILPIAAGGTGQDTAQEAIDALLPAQATANGKFLTSNGSASSWGTVASSGYSNVLFQWHGTDIINDAYGVYLNGTKVGANNYLYSNSGTANALADNSFVTLFSTKFIKQAGISTVTVYFYATHTSSGSQPYVDWKCDIGGQSGTVQSSDGSSQLKWRSFTVNVSSLTNGTAYDVVFQLRDTLNTTNTVYDLIAFGS
jgi:hypothetical protein